MTKRHGTRPGRIDDDPAKDDQHQLDESATSIPSTDQDSDAGTRTESTGPRGGRDDQNQGNPRNQAPSETEPAAPDGDLADGLTALSQLSTGRMSLPDLLTEVARYAVWAIPGAGGAGLTLLETGQADIIVKSHSFVGDVDDLQYGLGQGPCISAAAHDTTIRSGSLGRDPRWPRFGPPASRLGVHSVLSLPLRDPDGVLGAMNVYARTADAFDDRAQRIGQRFAAPAAIAVRNAQVLAQTRRFAENLQSAMNNRSVVDQAIGILIGMTGITADEAYTHLHARSQQKNTKLFVIAQHVITEAVNRAHATRAPKETS